MNEPKDLLKLSRRNLLLMTSMTVIFAVAIFLFVLKAWFTMGQDPIPTQVTMKLYLSCREVLFDVVFAVLPAIATLLVALAYGVWWEWRRLGRIKHHE
jgi:hypothetical protein